MPLFSGGQSGAAPLQVQLDTVAVNITAAVVGFSAKCESAAGTASRPVISRPSTRGVGTGSYAPFDPSRATARSRLITNFSSAPSLPSVTSGPFNLPIRMNWIASPRHAIIIENSTLLLYATAAGGATWTGELVWEEV